MRKQNAKTISRSYVTVAVSNDNELARDYVEMLQANEIPARFIVNDGLVENAGAAILVDEEFIDLAKSLINGRNGGGDFYDDRDFDGSSEKTEKTIEMEE